MKPELTSDILAVTVSGLPPMNGTRAKKVEQHITEALAGVTAHNSEWEALHLFPTLVNETPRPNLGQKILVQVDGITLTNSLVPQCIANTLGEAVYKDFPRALVICCIGPLTKSNGFWSSEG